MIQGFTDRRFAAEGFERTVYVAGSGPPVVVIHEIPGLHPGVEAFARRLVRHGFQVWMPSLFGTPTKPVGPLYMGRSIARACVSRAFTTWALGQSSPIVAWLRALSALAHEESGGQPVGAIGMCLTGGFALAMAVDDHLAAPVLSQPSCPFALTPARRRALDIAPDELARVQQRDVCVLGLRFTGDPMVPGARFRFLEEALGERFEAFEIDSSLGSGLKPWAHSVLGVDFVDAPGHPTVAALERVLAFFDTQLRPRSDTDAGHPSA